MKRTMELQIPRQLTLLCDLLEITPQEVLQGFINDLSQEVHASNGSDERKMAAAYFLRVGYGTGSYEWEQVSQMLEGLDILRGQWPGNDPEAEKNYRRQCRTYLKQWYRQWKAQQNPSR